MGYRSTSSNKPRPTKYICTFDGPKLSQNFLTILTMKQLEKSVPQKRLAILVLIRVWTFVNFMYRVCKVSTLMSDLSSLLYVLRLSCICTCTMLFARNEMNLPLKENQHGIELVHKMTMTINNCRGRQVQLVGYKFFFQLINKKFFQALSQKIQFNCFQIKEHLIQLYMR